MTKSLLPTLFALLCATGMARPCLALGEDGEGLVDRFRPLLGHLLASFGGRTVTVVSDDAGMELMREGAFESSPSTKVWRKTALKPALGRIIYFLKQFHLNDASNIHMFKEKAFLSETVLFLLLGAKAGKEEHIAKQVEKFINIKACYAFILPRWQGRIVLKKET